MSDEVTDLDPGDPSEEEAIDLGDLVVQELPTPTLLQRFRGHDPLATLETSLTLEGLSRWPNRGLSIGFPALSQAVDGFRNYVYAVAGASRMGKSTLLLQIAYDLTRLHDDARVLFLTLDQPLRDVQLRLVGMAGQCNLEYLTDPNPQTAATYDKKKRKGLKLARRVQDRLIMVDESEGALTLKHVVEMVEELRAEERDSPLFVVIDPLYKLRSEVPVSASLDERTGHLMSELKTLAIRERVGVFVSTRLDRGAGAERPELKDLEGQSALLYEAAAVFLLYCDFANNGDTPFLEWEWGTDDMMVPIFELDVAKNKMGPACGRLFYRFYNSFARFKECSELEVDNFKRMLQNLRRHSGEEESKEPELPKVEDITHALPEGNNR